MALYLDTEFNGFGGQLISLALVSNKHNDEFYGVLPLPSKVHPWVVEHVVPFLVQTSEPHYAFRRRLHMFLKKYETEPIYADWPEDFAHLLNCMCEPGGVSFQLELEMRLINSGPLFPVVPHNALSDARALCQWHKLYVTGEVV